MSIRSTDSDEDSDEAGGYPVRYDDVDDESELE